MTNQHTPGPWRVSPSGKLICTQDGAHVNICAIEDNGNDSLAPLPNEVWPNAHLIAAAPELLEALIKIEPIVDAFTQDELSVTTIDEAAEILVSVRTAIRKARGEA